MSVKSFLSAVGGDVKKVFSFLGSPKGQQVIQTGEGLAVAAAGAIAGPGASNIVGDFLGMANTWMTEIFKTEAIATAAAQQEGTNLQKATAALTAMTPQALAFAQQHGLPAPTAAQLQAANDALVAFGNAFAAPQPKADG